jgi:hypothetical protein
MIDEHFSRLQKKVKRRFWCHVLLEHLLRHSRWKLASTVPSLSTQMEHLAHVVKEAMDVLGWETLATNNNPNEW